MKNSNHRIKFILWSKRLWSESKLSLIFIVVLLIFGIGFLIVNLICNNKYSGNIVYSSLEWTGMIAGFVTMVFSIRSWIETQEIQDKIEARNKRIVNVPESNNTVLTISVDNLPSPQMSDVSAIKNTVNGYICQNAELKKNVGNLNDFTEIPNMNSEISHGFGIFRRIVSENQSDSRSIWIDLQASKIPENEEDAKKYYSSYCEVIDDIFKLINSENKKSIHVFFKGPGVLLTYVGQCSKNNATLFLYQNNGSSYIPLYQTEETTSAS